jgi:hypothetical protein
MVVHPNLSHSMNQILQLWDNKLDVQIKLH